MIWEINPHLQFLNPPAIKSKWRPPDRPALLNSERMTPMNYQTRVAGKPPEEAASFDTSSFEAVFSEAASFEAASFETSSFEAASFEAASFETSSFEGGSMGYCSYTICCIITVYFIYIIIQ